jgi:transposase-like protein
MKTESFRCQLNHITKTLLAMTPAQRLTVQHVIQVSQPEITINELIQPIFNASPQCPHCHCAHFTKWGKAGAVQRYKCSTCHKTFNNKTKTPLAKLHKCELWDKYAQCMSLRLTLREAASICNINLKTSFLWRHRFLMAQSEHNHEKLSGIIEADEFFMAYSEKGSKHLKNNRKANKRGGQMSKKDNESKVAILLSIDRSEHMVSQVLAADTKAEITLHLQPYITEGSVLCSDGAHAYKDIAKVTQCAHKRLISTQQRVIDKVYYIQTVNGAIAHFKDWTERKMRGVATKYLAHYLAWFKETRAKLDKRQILVAAYQYQH